MRSKMACAFVTLCAAILLVSGCGDHPSRATYDGYTLHGLVLDARTAAPVSDVTVLIGLEPEPEFHEITVTDANGEFTLKPAPPTAPSNEVLRLQKPGFETVEVLARTASRHGEFLYRLELRLEPTPTP